MASLGLQRVALPWEDNESEMADQEGEKEKKKSFVFKGLDGAEGLNKNQISVLHWFGLHCRTSAWSVKEGY